MTNPSTLQTTVAERVAAQLRGEIQRGVLAGGEPLRQNEVAARLGVSSTPVREAFHMLERMGLVEREGRRGVRVFRPSMRDLVEGYQVREILESQAAGLAATQSSQEELATLTELIRRMGRPRIGQQELLRLNTEFHAQIARASSNRRLARAIVAEHAATSSFLAFLGVDSATAQGAQEEHAAVVAALQARDPEGGRPRR